VVVLRLVLAYQVFAAGFGFYVPLAALLFAPWPKLGVAVFGSGIALVATAIANMGPSRQMGFDQTIPECSLVKTAVVRLSRSPIYLVWLLKIPNTPTSLEFSNSSTQYRRHAYSRAIDRFSACMPIP
jgi:hypothetical protein